MAKRKGLSYEQKLINALESLPKFLVDKKHGIVIDIENDRARSNESRFEHIIDPRHELKDDDIKRIPKYLKTSILKKDKERSDTYNLYIKRNNYNCEFIKISLKLNFEVSNVGIIKTIYITKNFK